MSHYTIKWKAQCPACDKSTSWEQFKCKNCGKGNVRLLEYSAIGPGVYGCDYCSTPAFQLLTCPSCGKMIMGNDFVKPVGSKSFPWKIIVGVVVVWTVLSMLLKLM